jgi:superfamily II DNA or RNA helicase
MFFRKLGVFILYTIVLYFVLWKIELKSPKLLYTSTFNNSMKKNSGYSKESRTKPVILTTIERENVRLNSYIGKKGYTIPKAELPKGEEEFLKKDLFVKPFVPGAQFGNPNDQSTAFPVYRENNNKMYLPRFYGIQRYGVPDRCDIEPGDDIDVPFDLSLRDYQKNIVDIYCNHVSKPLSKDNTQHGGGGILEVFCGAGKTVMALNIISKLKKKTLILVHKEFLMNQWIERMNDFLPTARIGKIQGPVFDIEDKDVVIGMIQSLYDKEYSSNVFSSFGLTIIDEVHRIGSEQFSRTLFKTITPYMLGISATVERKDKLTKVLYMFIGGKIYESARKEVDPVCVRAIEYISADTAFNYVDVDYRGNTKFSSMIVKLCAFGPRSDFIVNVLRDLLEEHPENQIMILCQNKSLLNYLYEAINYREIASVGYYIGGMKQVKLQETETKKIVLATYAMAAEALDIKTLATLVMVSPKTDIVQSVGRILRVKHKHPIIVDIVDMHENFQKQWLQRRRYYKKCNYRIRMTDSKKYTDMMLDWETDTTWKRVYEPKEIVDGGGEDEEDIPVVRKCLINVEDC